LDNITIIKEERSDEISSESIDDLLEGLKPYVDDGVEVLDAKAIPTSEKVKKNEEEL